MSSFEAGRAAYHGWKNSQAYTCLTRAMTADLAIKLFMAPCEEIRSQMALPEPKDRKEWKRGWEFEAKSDEPS